MWPSPVTLSGDHAVLEPLSQSHTAALQEAARGLQGLWYTMVPTVDGVAEEISRRQRLELEGSMRPFTVLDTAGRPIGMTTYMNIDAPNKRLEIGSTWLSPAVQRGPVNTECKLMLLTHAFETLGCVAVEFRTHIMNMQSRRAIERLGAKLDGILRNHVVLKNGTLRDTAVYSILNTEWPAVQANLSWQLTKPRD